MSRDFLQLWHHTTADWHLSESYILSHAGSDQFHRVQPGDTIWTVTVYPPGELVLLGRLRVGERTDYQGARERFRTDDIWEAKYHVIAESGTEEPLQEVDLMDVARELRFVSKINDRLDLVDGLVKAQQLQTMRELTPESAKMLEGKWSASNRRNAPIERFVWREGDVRIVHDPRKERKKSEDAIPSDKQEPDLQR